MIKSLPPWTILSQEKWVNQRQQELLRQTDWGEVWLNIFCKAAILLYFRAWLAVFLLLSYSKVNSEIIPCNLDINEVDCSSVTEGLPLSQTFSLFPLAVDDHLSIRYSIISSIGWVFMATGQGARRPGVIVHPKSKKINFMTNGPRSWLTCNWAPRGHKHSPYINNIKIVGPQVTVRLVGSRIANEWGVIVFSLHVMK